MNNNIREKFEENVPYIVKLKEHTFFTNSFDYFVGYLVNSANGNFYFELTDSRMLIIVPHAHIYEMRPHSKTYVEYRNKRLEEEE